MVNYGHYVIDYIPALDFLLDPALSLGGFKIRAAARGRHMKGVSVENR
jgi:hypothetical protein